ncbi:hypothetical protein ACOSP7_032698 [Xanthoceras sorbifolium]
MDAEEVATLCASLSLMEASTLATRIEGKLKEVGDRKLSLCLVGKIWTNKQVNREAFRATIPKIWRTKQEVQVEVLQENIFVFHFRTYEDRQRVLSGGPWSFDRCLLVLEEPEGAGHIHSMTFRKVKFWIQVYNAPLVCMNKEVGSFLENKIGELCEIDVGATGDCLGKYLRVRVKIDITKPLQRCLKIDLGADEETILLLRYERLPDHCFHCGLVGHTVRECVIANKQKGEVDHSFGAWL